MQADKDGREVLNRYNGCVAQVLDLQKDDAALVDPDKMSGLTDRHARATSLSDTAKEQQLKRIKAGGWQVPYAKASSLDIVVNSASFDSNTSDLHTLDPTTQPRMPWQDVHCRIEGPAVSYLLKNFLDRWKVAGGQELPPPPQPNDFAQPGNTSIQVLRSASSKLRRAATPLLPAAGGAENHIYQAALQLIDKSRHFIYIENQFFVSDFGAFADFAGPGKALSPAAQYIKEGAAGISDLKLWAARKAYHESQVGDIDRIPENKVCARLIKRIQKAILDIANPKYHVYITLPVHPEGCLNDATVAVQVYWTMQTISFGKNSLLNGIRRGIKARELRDQGDNDHLRVINDLHNTEWQSVSDAACFDYVTLLNLRNYIKLGERYVTEQVYVHTKLMIVDDLYALHGSANINDRSLLGGHDSEIAVLVVDNEGGTADLTGKGKMLPVRAYARDLRMEIWKKIFGITGGVRAASHLNNAIEAPANPASWKAIQAQAKINAQAYEAVFGFVPRNEAISPSSSRNFTSNILPTWDPDADAPAKSAWGEKGRLGSAMPFDAIFWTMPQYNAHTVGQLDNVKGFFVAIPVHWTEGENVHIKYPSMLVTELESDKKPALKPAASVAQNDLPFGAKNTGGSQG